MRRSFCSMQSSSTCSNVGKGRYGSGLNEFLIEEPKRGLHVVAATTEIAMATGLRLAERTLRSAYYRASPPAQGGTL